VPNSSDILTYGLSVSNVFATLAALYAYLSIDAVFVPVSCC